jgi:biotin carboxyl carrier protein
VSDGDRVEAGQVLGVIELMKMEIELRADIPGHVRDCRVAAGQGVERDAALLRIEPLA